MFAPQPEQVRAAVLVSPLIFCPAPHVVWAVQVLDRWEPEDWYELAPQFEQVRAAVLLSPLIFFPAPHVV